MTVATFQQVTFRIRDDDGDETGATWLAVQGADYSMSVDVNFRVRFRVDETTGTKDWSNNTFNLYYSLNGGGYAAIDNTTPVQYATTGTGNYADGDDCTEQLTGGTGTFLTDNNGMSSGDASITNSGSAGNLFECEFCLTIDSAQVSNGNTIELQVYNGTSAFGSGYTDWPSITVVEVATLEINKAESVAVGDTVTASGPVETLSVSVSEKIAVEHPGNIAYIDLEEGDFSDFDSTVNETDMAVNGSAAMVGSYGLQVYLDGAGTTSYGLKNFTIGTDTMRFRLYFDPNSLSMVPNDTVWVFTVRHSGGVLFAVRLAYITDHYETDLYAYTDSTQTNSSNTTLSDGPHYIEVLAVRETADGDADGTADTWIDGIAGGSLSGLDNYNIFNDIAGSRVGPSYIQVGTPSGYIYIDDIAIRDDSVEIGAATDPVSVSVGSGAEFSPSVSDGITVGDTPTASMPDALAINVSDGIAASESFSATVSNSQISVSDGATVGDTNYVSIETAVDKSESISVSDAPTTKVRAAWYNPDSITVNTGSIVSGTIEDTWSDNGIKLQLAETTGSPAFSYDFYFYGVPATAYNITINGYYQGNPAHDKKIQQYNFTTTNWTDLTAEDDDFPSTTSDQDYTFALFGGVNYVQSGEVRIRIIHSSAGNITHNFYIDEMVMGQIPVVHTNESITVTDTPFGQVEVNASASESISASDSPSVEIETKVSATDSVSLTDTASAEVMNQIGVQDSVSVSDTPSVLLGDLTVGESDSIAVSDSPTVNVEGLETRNASASDSVAASDIASIEVETSSSASDSLGIADSATVEVSAPQVNASDGISATDTPTLSVQEAGALTVSVSDSVSASDSPTLEVEIEISSTETVAVSDAPSTSVAAPGAVSVSVTDSVTVGESQELSINLSVSVSETVATADVPSASVSAPGTIAISVSDSTNVADTPSLDIELNISESEAVTVADSPTASVQAAGALSVSLSESMTVGDSSTASVSINASVSETVSVAESASETVSASEIGASDSATVLDTPEVSVLGVGELAASVSESTLISDTPTVYVEPLADLDVNVSDSISVTDSLANIYQSYTIFAIETISASGTQSIITSSPQISVAEAISVSESLSMWRAVLAIPNSRIYVVNTEDREISWNQDDRELSVKDNDRSYSVNE